jgi:quinol monooxygenase YgiN
VVILNIKLSPKKNKKEEFLQTMPAILEAALGMEGCREAKCYSDIVEVESFEVNITWNSPKNMSVFMESNYFKALMGMKNLFISTPQIIAQHIGVKIAVKDIHTNAIPGTE